MLETKLEKIYPDEYSHEEQMINDYACFGWTLTQRSVAQKTVDGSTSDVAHNLTFQRDYNIPNKNKLDNMFLRYTVKKNEIQKAADAVAAPTRKYVTWFLIVTAICCAILFPTVYPAIMEGFWNPGVGLEIFMAFLVLVLACCGGALFGVVPIGIASSIKKQKAAGNVKGQVYAEMSSIAREAAQYLQ